MGQVSKCLRKTENGFVHWCIACKRAHHLPNGWNFNGNVNKPTFTPSFLHRGNRIETDESGQWTGEWILDSEGKVIPFVCHYILTDGIVNYCGDCTHEFAGKSVPIANLPKYYQDGEE